MSEFCNSNNDMPCDNRPQVAVLGAEGIFHQAEAFMACLFDLPINLQSCRTTLWDVCTFQVILRRSLLEGIAEYHQPQPPE